MTRARTSALITTTALVASVLAATTAATAAPAGTTPAAPTAAPAGSVRQVTLVTGDVVTVRTSGSGQVQTSVARRTTTGPGSQFESFTLGREVYVVPMSARPYLGSTLDLSLFDVTRLAQSRSSSVQLSFRTADPRATVPGLHITQRSGTSATATVTRSGAFSAALARQWVADHRAATHTTGLFAQLAHVAPSYAVPSTPHPDFAMYTLTVHGIDSAGHADTGDGPVIYNVDDLRKYGGAPVFVHGLAKVSVPGGHYAAICDFYDYVSNTVWQVTIPQFSVNGATSITIDARSATSAVTIATPRPAVPAILDVGVGRTDTRGLTGSYSFIADGSTTFLVQTTSGRVTVGQLHFYVYSRQFASDDSYSYDLKFPTDGAIPAAEHYVARASQLAAVASAYPATHPNTTSFDTRFAALPWEDFLFAADVQFATPVQRMEYYSALPGLSWQGVDFTVVNLDTFDLLGMLQSAWRSYAPGVRLSTTWGGSPAIPRLLEAPVYPGTVACPACLSGHTAYLLGYPFSDNSPEHFGFPDGQVDGLTESYTFAVYGDDVPVQHGLFLDTSVRVPSAVQTFRLDYDTTRSSADFTLSTDVRTSWTVPMSAATTALPAGWVCSLAADVSGCRVMPLITASYQLPVNLLGALAPGSSTAHLLLAHLAASALAFRTVSVAASYDGGQTWRSVPVSSQGAGDYALALSVPANGDGYGALRVSVRDAAGGTFTQTIQHAFAVSAS